MHAGIRYLSASSMGSRFSSAVSLGSLNHDFIGIALSVKRKHSLTHTLTLKPCREYNKEMNRRLNSEVFVVFEIMF